MCVYICMYLCVQCAFSFVHIYIHTHTNSAVRMCVFIYSACAGLCALESYNVGRAPSDGACESSQDFVEAFMMGTHARLGAHSPVLLLDHDIAVSIAQIIIADKW
jgi:hypothetical protein